MLVRRKFTAVPWMKLRLRRYFTFFSSSFRILPVVLFSRSISCCPSPRLLTSSMLRSDSVVEPASAVVSPTICFWIVLIRLLSTELMMPSTGTVSRNIGAMSQCTVNAYTMTKMMPTSDVKTTLIDAEISRSTSDRTFCSLPSVSPLR